MAALLNWVVSREEAVTVLFQVFLLRGPSEWGCSEEPIVGEGGKRLEDWAKRERGIDWAGKQMTENHDWIHRPGRADRKGWYWPVRSHRTLLRQRGLERTDHATRSDS